jgi:hypothetical protein
LLSPSTESLPQQRQVYLLFFSLPASNFTNEGLLTSTLSTNEAFASADGGVNGLVAVVEVADDAGVAMVFEIALVNESMELSLLRMFVDFEIFFFFFFFLLFAPFFYWKHLIGCLTDAGNACLGDQYWIAGMH